MSDKELRLITFKVGAETFVLDIMAVRQIIPYTGSAPIPTAPKFIEGIIVLRNEVIPVIDLRERLHPEMPDKAENPLLLVTHSSAGVIGLKVDEVRRIVTLNSEALLPAPAMARGIRGEFLVAIAQQHEEIFLVLDVNSLLTADEQRELVKR